jgi:hypothetical protein
VLFQPLARSGVSQVEALPAATFFATHVDEHGKPGQGAHRS